MIHLFAPLLLAQFPITLNVTHNLKCTHLLLTCRDVSHNLSVCISVFSN